MPLEGVLQYTFEDRFGALLNKSIHLDEAGRNIAVSSKRHPPVSRSLASMRHSPPGQVIPKRFSTKSQ